MSAGTIRRAGWAGIGTEGTEGIGKDKIGKDRGARNAVPYVTWERGEGKAFRLLFFLALII